WESQKADQSSEHNAGYVGGEGWFGRYQRKLIVLVVRTPLGSWPTAGCLHFSWRNPVSSTILNMAKPEVGALAPSILTTQPPSPHPPPSRRYPCRSRWAQVCAQAAEDAARRARGPLTKEPREARPETRPPHSPRAHIALHAR